jgi:hypothetical protein
MAIAGAALIGVGACSSDSSNVSVEDLTTIDVSLPPGVTLPPGITDECQAIYLQFVTAMSSVYIPNTGVNYDQVFGDLSAKVPADLQDDLVILSAAFHQYGEILAANNNDSTSPAVQQAVAELVTDEVNDASNNVMEYFEATCPTTG